MGTTRKILTVGLVTVLVLFVLAAAWVFADWRGIFPKRVETSSEIVNLRLSILNYRNLLGYLRSFGLFKKNGVLVGDYEFGEGVTPATVNRFLIVLTPSIQNYGYFKIRADEPLFLSFDFSVIDKRGTLRLYVDERLLDRYGRGEVAEALNSQLLIYFYQISASRPRYTGSMTFKTKEIWESVESIKNLFRLESKIP